MFQWLSWVKKGLDFSQRDSSGCEFALDQLVLEVQCQIPSFVLSSPPLPWVFDFEVLSKGWGIHSSQIPTHPHPCPYMG